MRWLPLEADIKLIQNPDLQKWVIDTLDKVPEYFYKAPASSTGKYHPACTNKEGGLLVHVRRAVYIANRLCDGYKVSGMDKDCVIAAVILHDIAKCESYKDFKRFEDHPILAEQYFAEAPKTLEPYILSIRSSVRYHMGPWTPASIRKDLSDYTLSELLVYTSDYIATTKELITPVDNG